MSIEPKTDLRQRMLKLRAELPAEVRAKKSLEALGRLENLEAFKKAEHVLFYCAKGAEVETMPLLKRIFGTKKVYLPVITKDSIFEPVQLKNPLDLMPGKEGILEPGDKTTVATHLDLIVVPGVAFDKSGHRLGMGKGYYDRFLPRFPNALKVGLAYFEQIVEKIPQDVYDEAVDLIVTDQMLYTCRAFN